jgi:segregation and condensation protein A
VKLEVFEGPLDLLLHLIRLNEVDIADIPIARISEQYLEYLDLMRELDIEIAGEYLLMAATLAHIKSQMLLPPAPEEEPPEGPDPREELARRLAEYAALREAASQLAARPRLGLDVFVPEPGDAAEREGKGEIEVSLFGLLEALRRVLKELPEPSPHAVVLERVSVQSRMSYVMELLREAGGAISFEDLLRGSPLARHYLVVTFLAILELARLRTIRLYQARSERGRPEGPIRVRLVTLEDRAVG